MTTKYVTLAYVADRLGMSRPNLYRYINDGYLRTKKLGGSTVVEESEATRFVHSFHEVKDANGKVVRVHGGPDG